MFFCNKSNGDKIVMECISCILMLRIFSQEIYGDNGGIYQIKIYKKMLTPNYGCFGATYKFTCSDTVFTSLVMFFFMLTILQLLVLVLLILS